RAPLQPSWPGRQGALCWTMYSTISTARRDCLRRLAEKSFSSYVIPSVARNIALAIDDTYEIPPRFVPERRRLLGRFATSLSASSYGCFPATPELTLWRRALI